MKGYLYPAALVTTFLFIFFAYMIVLMFGNRDLFFSNGGPRTYCTIFTLIFLFLYAICAYCYITAVTQSPGSPPRFWVSLEGVLPARSAGKTEALLRALQLL